MMKQGIYKISGTQPGGGDSRHYGRLAVVNGHTQVLEDTKDGILHRAFPDGIVDDLKSRRWASLLQNPYFKVSTEGLLDDEAKEAIQPDVKPEEIFDVVDVSGTRQILEAFGENLFLDGKKLDPKALDELRRRIHIGELHLLPRTSQ